jgi:hypothetical protein
LGKITDYDDFSLTMTFNGMSKEDGMISKTASVSWSRSGDHVSVRATASYSPLASNQEKTAADSEEIPQKAALEVFLQAEDFDKLYRIPPYKLPTKPGEPDPTKDGVHRNYTIAIQTGHGSISFEHVDDTQAKRVHDFILSALTPRLRKIYGE